MARALHPQGEATATPCEWLSSSDPMDTAGGLGAAQLDCFEFLHIKPQSGGSSVFTDPHRGCRPVKGRRGGRGGDSVTWHVVAIWRC